MDGPLLSIRRFAVVPFSVHDLISMGTLTSGMADLINGVVRARLNVLVSGGTGSGKTTLLNVMSASIPGDERIITIKDAAELQLQQPHVLRMETRPPNIEGDVISMLEIFRFEQTGLDPDGRVQGQFVATGIRPKFMQRLVTRGIVLNDKLFEPTQRWS